MTNREIKIKAFHIESGVMLEWSTISQSAFNYHDCSLMYQILVSRRTEYQLLQFTGLESSDHGCGMPIKDAYFGDIIEFFNTDGKRIVAEIIWYDKEHCIGFKRISDGFVLTQRIFNDSGYFQPSKIQFNIIGNIYETPELLK